MSKRVGRRHAWIPDGQNKPNVNTDHIAAAANYLVDKQPDVIVVGGDWWEMASLSQYEDRGSKYFHDKTYRADVDAGNSALARLMAPIAAEAERRVVGHRRRWEPELHFLLGNHEERILRATYQDPKLEGTIGLGDLHIHQWGLQRHDYQDVIEIDGVLYSHCFVGVTASASIDTCLRKLGCSFTQGHLTRYRTGTHYNAKGQRLRGLVAGAFYSHEDEWRGPQDSNYWRGIIIKNEVRDGEYDLCEVSLDYLVREWL